MLDDLQDEGYFELALELEETISGITRLRKYLTDHHAMPFELSGWIADATDLTYCDERVELDAMLDQIIEEVSNQPPREKELNPFIDDLIDFCEWVGYEENTAYIFLLRDTMLPYLYYSGKGRMSLYPWLMGRKMMEELTGQPAVDDVIRAPLVEALEEGHVTALRGLCDFAFPRIRTNLEPYPAVTATVMSLLNQIPEQRIIVVESGCYGTFPMLLACFDPRVDIRMYTSVPYFTDVYSERLFTKEYEKVRLFETLYCQDLFFQFAGVLDNRFFVEQCTDKTIGEKAIKEIRQMLD